MASWGYIDGWLAVIAAAVCSCLEESHMIDDFPFSSFLSWESKVRLFTEYVSQFLSSVASDLGACVPSDS